LRVDAKPVGAGLPAIAISWTPSPASRLLQGLWGCSGIEDRHKTCRSPACRRWRFRGRHRRQAGSYRDCGGVRGLRVDTKPVGAWLAGDGDFVGAIASKPAPTRIMGCSGFGDDTKPVGARLAGDGDCMGAIAGKPAPTGIVGVFGIWGCRKTCRSPACRRWRLHGHHRRQACRLLP